MEKYVYIYSFLLFVVEIEEATIGGWFQRTTLHLTEVFDFIQKAKSDYLDTDQLRPLRNGLGVESTERKNWLLEYVEARSRDKVLFKFYEDGLVVLRKQVDGDVDSVLDELQNYYDDRLSPALKYLFSRGAPVPKEMAKIHTLLPFILIAKNANKDKYLDFLVKEAYIHIQY